MQICSYQDNYENIENESHLLWKSDYSVVQFILRSLIGLLCPHSQLQWGWGRGCNKFMLNWWWIFFAEWLTEANPLISSRDHFQRFSPLQICDTPRARFRSVENLRSDFVKWNLCNCVNHDTMALLNPTYSSLFPWKEFFNGIA